MTLVAQRQEPERKKGYKTRWEGSKNHGAAGTRHAAAIDRSWLAPGARPLVLFFLSFLVLSKRRPWCRRFPFF
jgi:hypothetical protein